MRSLFYIGFREIQINTNFAQIRQKRQYNLKTTILGRSSPKSIGFLRKHIQITMQNFRAIGATSFELSRDKKLTTYTHTHTDTHTYIFSRRLFFQCRSYINKGNGEIWQLIFETNSRLYWIKDWESKKYYSSKKRLFNVKQM